MRRGIGTAPSREGRGAPLARVASAAILPLFVLAQAARAEVTFVDRVIASGVPGPGATVAADVDRDGLVDVLGASFADDTVAWWRNDGALPPTFTRHVISATAAGAIDVVASDLDGDHDLDVVALGENIAWYENDGANPPAFVEHVISSDAASHAGLALGDLDRDGDTDIVAAIVEAVPGLGTIDHLVWFENGNEETPTFGMREIAEFTGGFLEELEVVDVGDDGDLDVVTAGTLGFAGFPVSTAVEWFENDDGLPPAFSRSVITQKNSSIVRTVEVSDLDGDGLPDVIAAIEVVNEPARLVWFSNEETSFIERPIATFGDGNPARGLATADVDNDGDVDVVAGSPFDDRINWYESDGAPIPSFTARVVSSDARGASRVIAVDFDGDVDVDVVAHAFSTSEIVWYENGGVLAPDADGDGDPDATDPDDDNDKVSDEEEIAAGSNPLDPTSTPEVCDGVDNDGDGEIDEGLPTQTFYRDLDGDGYGHFFITAEACEAPLGFVANDDDCSEMNPDVHPGATEVCDQADNDCDGATDEDEVCGVPDSDQDGIPDDEDVEGIEEAVADQPDSSFKSKGHRNAIHNALEEAEALIAAGDKAGAIQRLQQLRSKVDGCEKLLGLPIAENDDWITDCTAQREIRDLIDQLIANLRE